ncbi:MAG TPA: ribose-phosphate pyrophosphokinase [bacterium]|nr:ribose-phosphate pyrophosphokinase [bacterium]
MDLLLFPLPGSEEPSRSFAEAIGARTGEWSYRRFPDGEFYLRVDTPIAGAAALLFGSLDRPDSKMLPMLFLAETLKDLGAKKVVLVAPYLAYLRQDARFQPGEGVTSRYFARLLGQTIDGLVTVDPHLHRYASLGEIYDIPTRVAHAAGSISEWIRAHVPRPLVVGPDRESEQWAGEVARGADAPFFVLEKTRKGDREVEISSPQGESYKDRTPVIVDDIISSGKTLAAAAARLIEAGFARPIGIGIHPVFSGNAADVLQASGLAELVTCNTIPHATNRIDLSASISEALREMLGDNT